MAVISAWYLGGIQRMIKSQIDLLTDPNIRAMLVGPGYVYDPAHTFVDSGAGSAGGEEIVVAGYSGGNGGASRIQLANKTITRSNALRRIIFDADDLNFGPLGGGPEVTVSACIIIKQAGDDASSPLICYAKFPERSTDGQDFPVIFGSAGVAVFNAIVPT